MTPVNQRQPGSVPPPPVSDEPSSRVDNAYHAILLRIVRGEFSGGMELKSTQLARSLGMSRTPVVQALHRLAADGIVQQTLNKRAIIRPGAESWLVEIHQMRELLEPKAAALAAERIPAEELDRLEAMSRLAAPRDDGDWFAAAQAFDFALHLAMAEHCGNLVLGEAIRKCWSYKRLSYEAVPEKPESLACGYREHLAILAALRARDGETAAVATHFHLRSAVMLRPAERIV